MEKELLRRQMKQLRKEQSALDTKQNDSIMMERFLSLSEYKDCINLLSYVSYKEEADTKGLLQYALQQGKKVAVPKVIGKGLMDFYRIDSLSDLKIGAYGILEPDTSCCFTWKPAEKTMMLLPGLAFDYEFYRLGYGGGYYDRYLFNHKQFSFYKVAFSYPFQRLSWIPREPFDQPIDIIITPEATYHNH